MITEELVIKISAMHNDFAKSMSESVSAIQSLRKELERYQALDRSTTATMVAGASQRSAAANNSNKSMTASINTLMAANTNLSSSFERATDNSRKFTTELNKAIETANKMPKLNLDFGSGRGGNGGNSGGLLDTISSMAQRLFYLKAAAETAGSALSGLFHAAEEGAKMRTMSEFFKNSGKDIMDYRQATKGLISDQDLLSKANLADSMGISGDVFKKLAVIAEAAAMKTGQSFDYMFNSIVTGTARSSRLLLDNLGIIVSMSQAKENYAREVGKSVALLTKEEQQLAFNAEVARKGDKAVQEYNNTLDRSAEIYGRIQASTENVLSYSKQLVSISFAGIFEAALSPLQSLVDMLKLATDTGMTLGDVFSAIIPWGPGAARSAWQTVDSKIAAKDAEEKRRMQDNMSVLTGTNERKYGFLPNSIKMGWQNSNIGALQQMAGFTGEDLGFKPGGKLNTSVFAESKTRENIRLIAGGSDQIKDVHGRVVQVTDGMRDLVGSIYRASNALGEMGLKTRNKITGVTTDLIQPINEGDQKDIAAKAQADAEKKQNKADAAKRKQETKLKDARDAMYSVNEFAYALQQVGEDTSKYAKELEQAMFSPTDFEMPKFTKAMDKLVGDAATNLASTGDALEPKIKDAIDKMDSSQLLKTLPKDLQEVGAKLPKDQLAALVADSLRKMIESVLNSMKRATFAGKVDVVTGVTPQTPQVNVMGNAGEAAKSIEDITKQSDEQKAAYEAKKRADENSARNAAEADAEIMKARQEQLANQKHFNSQIASMAASFVGNMNSFIDAIAKVAGDAVTTLIDKATNKTIDTTKEAALKAAESGSALAQGISQGGAAGGGPWGAIIGAIVTVFIELLKKLKPIIDIVGTVLDGFIQLLANALGPQLTALVPAFKALAGVLVSIGTIIQGINQIADPLGIIPPLLQFLATNLGWIATIFKMVGMAFQGAIKFFREALYEMLPNWVIAAATDFGNAIADIGTHLNLAKNDMATFGAMVQDAFKIIGELLYTVIVIPLEATFAALYTVAGGVAVAFMNVLGGIQDMIGNLLNSIGLGDQAIAMWNSGNDSRKTGQAISKSIGDAWNSVIADAMKAGSLGHTGGFTEVNADWWKGVGDDFNNNTDAVKENTKAIRDLTQELKNMPSGYKAAAAAYAAATPRGTPDTWSSGGSAEGPKTKAGIPIVGLTQSADVYDPRLQVAAQPNKYGIRSPWNP